MNLGQLLEGQDAVTAYNKGIQLMLNSKDAAQVCLFQFTFWSHPCPPRPYSHIVEQLHLLKKHAQSNVNLIHSSPGKPANLVNHYQLLRDPPLNQELTDNQR